MQTFTWALCGGNYTQHHQQQEKQFNGWGGSQRAFRSWLYHSIAHLPCSINSTWSDMEGKNTQFDIIVRQGINMPPIVLRPGLCRYSAAEPEKPPVKWVCEMGNNRTDNGANVYQVAVNGFIFTWELVKNQSFRNHNVISTPFLLKCRSASQAPHPFALVPRQLW